MALLDGKYEVISQQHLGDHLTLFIATDNTGHLVAIEWFELAPEQEPLFEQHRRLLRRWQREQRATLIDIVSRPGARYAVWPHRSSEPKRITSGALFQELRQAGYAPDAITLEKDSTGNVVLTGLQFHGAEPVATPVAAPPAPATATRQITEASMAWLITAGAAVLAVALLAASFFVRSVDTTVVVPNGIGQPVQAVLDQLYELGFATEALGIASTATPGTVLRLDPPAGAVLRPARTVQVSYSTPEGQLAQAEVPNVVGSEYPAATRQLLFAGQWEVGEVLRIHASQPAGTVLAQLPAAGSSAPSNTPVTLLVSAGSAATETVLPPLVGLTREEAIAVATLAGVPENRIVIEEAPGDARSRGRVLAQSLSPHRPITPSRVTLRLLVASGSAEAPSAWLVVPDFVGLSEAEAEARAGAWTIEKELLGTRELPPGVVMQTPEPRTEVTDLEPIVLVVNRHPRALPVANATVEIRPIGLRRVPYAWNIEPGILGASAEVWAETVDGKRSLVSTSSVFGGSQVRGTWPTLTPGPVRFELFLNNQPYGDVLVVPED